MFCVRCGKQVDDTLKFCNSCGAQLKKEEDAPRSILNSLTTTLVVVGTGGLGILVGLVAVLLDKIPHYEPVLMFAVVYLIILFGICFMILRQIAKLIDADLQSRKPPVEQLPLHVQLPRPSQGRLEEYREPTSVTDHTTRTLDKAPASKL